MVTNIVSVSINHVRIIQTEFFWAAGPILQILSESNQNNVDGQRRSRPMQSAATVDWLLLTPKWSQTCNNSARGRTKLRWGPVLGGWRQTGKGVRGAYTLCCWRQPTWRRWRPRPPPERRKGRWRRRTWGPWARSSRDPAGTWREWWGSRAPTPLRDTKSRRSRHCLMDGFLHTAHYCHLFGWYCKRFAFFNFRKQEKKHVTEMHFLGGSEQ